MNCRIRARKSIMKKSLRLRSAKFDIVESIKISQEVARERKRRDDSYSQEHDAASELTDIEMVMDMMQDAECIDCGASYIEFGVDFVFPGLQWKEICPEDGILCGSCIAKRVGATDAVKIIALIDFGGNLGYWDFVGGGVRREQT